MNTNVIYNEDCFKLMRTIPAESVDFIITDPPYNINYKSNHGKKVYQEKIQTAQKWDNNFNTSLYIDECLRIAKNNTYILVFGCFKNIKLMLDKGCCKILIWNKLHCGMGNLKDFGIGYEYIFMFKKGKPILKKGRVNGVINFKHIGYFDKSVHPTQKPIGLLKYLIENCTDEGALVFDGVVGSGTTVLACLQSKRQYIACELNSDYYKICLERIKKNETKTIL